MNCFFYKNKTRSADVNHHENHQSYHDQYSELWEGVPMYVREVEWKLVAVAELDPEEIKFLKGMNRPPVREQKVVETLKAQVVNLIDSFNPEGVLICSVLWMTTLHEEEEAYEKCHRDYLQPSLQSTTKLFDDENVDISRLANLAGIQLEKIKAYNSERLALLKAENLNEERLKEMSHHYLRFYNGIRSLNLKIEILKFHLTHSRCELKNLVDKFSAALRGELRQYKEELETTRSKVYEIITMQTLDKSLSWLPNSWKTICLSAIVKPIILDARVGGLMRYIELLDSRRTYVKDKIV